VVLGRRAKEKAKEKSDSAKGYRVIPRIPNPRALYVLQTIA
jgi:DNA integrity scanning protein DisA with diadenylate cyclase activity